MQVAQSLKDVFVVVTGGNRGVGLTACKAFAARGANVVLGCRNVQQGQQAIGDHIQSAVLDKKSQVIDCLPLDLKSLESVNIFAGKVMEKCSGAPHILINNAGVMQKTRRQTIDGNEETLQVNYLSPTLLTLLFAQNERLQRVVTMSAGVHRMFDTQLSDLQFRQSYDGWKAYVNSKRLEMLFSNLVTRALKDNVDDDLAFLKDANLKSVCLDPGWIKTSLVRPEHGFNEEDIKKKMGGASTDPSIAVKTVLMAALDPTVKSGDFVVRERISKVGRGIDSITDQDKLWKMTKELIKWPR